MKFRFPLFLLTITLSIILVSCKTTQSAHSKTAEEKTTDELLQSTIDTSSFVGLSPDEIRKATLLAQEMGQIYCNIKRYEGMDLTIIENEKALSATKFDSIQLQKQVNALSDFVKVEYDRVLEESTEKCKDW